VASIAGFRAFIPAVTTSGVPAFQGALDDTFLVDLTPKALFPSP